MAIWQRFKGLPPKTRIFIGVGIMAYAGASLYLTDETEVKYGLTPTEKEEEEFWKAIPKISIVEKKGS